MFVIGENIQIRATQVKRALQERDAVFLQQLAQSLVEAGSHMIDLNIGPRKKDGPEVMTWLVETVSEVVDVPLSFDTTNLDAIETGLKVARSLRAAKGIQAKDMLNPGSLVGDAARTERIFSLAVEYGAGVVGLTLEQTGMPVSTDERVNIALEQLIPPALEYGLPVQDLYIDPVVLTVKGMQEHPKEIIEAVRMCKMALDPAPMTTCGLSNVSNSVPHENRSLINRTFLVMMLGAGLDSAICDPLDLELMEWVRVVEERDESSAMNQALLRLYDKVQAMEMGSFGPGDVDMDDPEQAALYKTVRILRNEVIFADDYLRY
ncbi:MAG: dihydropteroate synthase [Chloroflexia bacterium]|nr:dihydropteroate synthase [Chloroflexia bacterium]